MLVKSCSKVPSVARDQQAHDVFRFQLDVRSHDLLARDWLRLEKCERKLSIGIFKFIMAILEFIENGAYIDVAMWAQLDDQIFLHELGFELEKVVEEKQEVVQGLVLWKASAVEGCTPRNETGVFWISPVGHHQLDACFFLQSLEVVRHPLSRCLEEVVKAMDEAG